MKHGDIGAVVNWQFSVQQPNCKASTEVSRAAHGMSVSAMSWHKKFRGDLEKEDFTFNPCDPCAANRVIRGHQQTTRFHADDVMSSHIDAKVNDEFEAWLNKMHGEHGEVESA